MRRINQSGSTRGVAMIEMAIILPIFLIVILGAFDGYIISSRQMMLRDAVRKASIVLSASSTAQQTCSDRLNATVRSLLSEWGLASDIESIEADALSGELTETRNAFSFTVTLGVSCVTCSAGKEGKYLAEASAVVVLDPGNFCEPLPWGGAD